MKDVLEEPAVSELLGDGLQVRMVEVEGYEPVGHLVEEREALHLGESAEIDIRSLLLHIEHLVEAGLDALQIGFCLIRMQDLVEVALVGLFYPVAGDAEAGLLHQIGHDLILNSGVVALSIDTIEELLLQLNEFLTAGFILEKGLHQGICLRVDAPGDLGIESESPADEGSLAHLFVGGFLIEVYQETELGNVEAADRRQHHGCDEELTVGRIDGWRVQHLFHR